MGQDGALARVLRAAAEPAPAGQEAAACAHQTAPARRRPTQPGLELRLHGRCAVVRSPLQDLQRHRRVQREGLRIEVDTSLPAARVIRALNELVEVRGAPLSIRLDNGPEFIANALALWAQSKGIALQHIQPGKPTQNAYVERFNKTYRTEVLDCYVFESLQEVRDMTADWLHRYNHHRPHEALGRIPPVEYRVKLFPNLYF